MDVQLEKIVRSDGSIEWGANGKLHNPYGPAIIADDGKEWWLNGKMLSKEDFTTIEMINRMQALELFTVEELLSFSVL